MDEDELMVQWFELVNAKNDLVRKEADLMYQQRQQELEVLHEELEYDLRCLMDKPGMNSCCFRCKWFYFVSRMTFGQYVFIYFKFQIGRRRLQKKSEKHHYCRNCWIRSPNVISLLIVWRKTGSGKKLTRKSSCVNARGIPTAAYQVLLGGVPPIRVPPPQPGPMGGTRGGVPSIGVPPG